MSGLGHGLGRKEDEGCLRPARSSAGIRTLRTVHPTLIGKDGDENDAAVSGRGSEVRALSRCV